MYAVVYRVSTEFIIRGYIDMEKLYVTLFALMLGIMGVGQSSGYMTEVGEMRIASQ